MPQPAPPPPQNAHVTEVSGQIRSEATWRLTVRLPDGQECATALVCPAGAPLLQIDAGLLRFQVPEGRHLYLSSTGSTNFAAAPPQSALPLQAGREYRLRAACVLEGGRASLWLIEYDEGQRLTHWVRPLSTGPVNVQWATHARCCSCCLAIRLSGAGALRLSGLELTTPGARPAVRVGPRGAFAAYSLFYDPAGYKPYVERHHRYYDEPRRDWYERMAQPFAHCGRVLELGCGPGLLLEALGQVGVGQAVGLERDAVYLEGCRARGVTAIAHDLNEPFPFVPSSSVDGVVAHSCFDYLAPIALRTTLRECLRVLKPGGRLRFAARHDGQASGDEARCSVPLLPELACQLLREAGFEQVEVEVRQRVVEVAARKPAAQRHWPTRSVVLNGGYQVHPWGERRTVLSPEPDAWDNASSRDFTILTDAQKNEFRVDGMLVAYYTGYRKTDSATLRAVCRCVSQDGLLWQRRPEVPVLEAGAPGSWDAGGVAAGSVIATPDAHNAGFVMYYSGRTPQGLWPGIGLARSADGIRWEKQAGRVLEVEAYPGLTHLALADVIRASDGRWLMHCEGWIRGRGWAVFQAESEDGVAWRPTQTEPVLDPRSVPWGGQHAANPKCLEVEPGRFVLGFNAADATGAFQLALAESTDARHWCLIDVNPALCTGAGDFRIESLFMTRDAWRRGDRRVYFFSAATSQTHLSSRVLASDADPTAEWVGAPWRTQRCGLYRVRVDRLVAEPGATGEPHALTRSVRLERETQCTLRLAPERPGRGAVVLALEGTAGMCEIRIHGDGHCTRDGTTLVGSAAAGLATAACLRVLLPPGAGPELRLLIWHGQQQVVDLHEALGVGPVTLHARVMVPPGEPALLVDHLDIWQPEPMQVEACGDAHMYMGVCRSWEALLPDIDRDAFRGVLRKHQIGRALVAPYGSTAQLDTFDQISPLVGQERGRVYALLRVRSQATARPEDHQFRIHQLELLWQKGLLTGLKVKLNAPERPAPEVLAWVERRQLLTMWHVSSPGDLDWLRHNVLERFTFPVLLSHFGGYPLDGKRYRACIELLEHYPHLYLVTSAVCSVGYLEEALRQHPHQILLGSDFPAVDPTVAREAVMRLDIPEATRVLVLGENLRFLTERVAWRRWNVLRQREDLLFPPPPETPEEVAAQGFEIVPPEKLPADEAVQARDHWSSQEVSSFYLEYKPWAAVVAGLARDLGARSVLEFGCNVGRNLVAVREANPGVRLVGLDINPQAVQAGRERSGLDLRVGDQAALAAFGDGEFDLVFTVSVLDHIPAVADVCRELVRVAARNALFLEVRLPVEGKVVRHFDHRHATVYPSTEASYSWFLERYLADNPRLWRLDCRPCYLHSSRLGPYYCSYLAFLEPPQQPPRKTATVRGDSGPPPAPPDA